MRDLHTRSLAALSITILHSSEGQLPRPFDRDGSETAAAAIRSRALWRRRLLVPRRGAAAAATTAAADVPWPVRAPVPAPSLLRRERAGPALLTNLGDDGEHSQQRRGRGRGRDDANFASAPPATATTERLRACSTAAFASAAAAAGIPREADLGRRRRPRRFRLEASFRRLLRRRRFPVLLR